jgi:hypothetical protein
LSHDSGAVAQPRARAVNCQKIMTTHSLAEIALEMDRSVQVIFLLLASSVLLKAELDEEDTVVVGHEDEEDDGEWSLSFKIVVVIWIACLSLVGVLLLLEFLRAKKGPVGSATVKTKEAETPVLNHESKGSHLLASVHQVAPMASVAQQDPGPAEPKPSILQKLMSLFVSKKASSSPMVETAKAAVEPKTSRPVRFIADHFLKNEFDPDVHRKYHASVYYQTGTTKPMTDAERNTVSSKAYFDFANGLADISQREPLSADHTGQAAKGVPKQDAEKLARQAQWERLIQDRYAADCTHRFKKRLNHRVKAFYDAKRRKSGPRPSDYRYGIPIRRDTAQLLSRTPEVDTLHGWMDG